MAKNKKNIKKQQPVVEDAPSKVDMDNEVTSMVSDTGFWKQNWWIFILIFGLGIGIYYQCTNFGYVLDDQIVITDNSFTKKGFAGMWDLLTTESMTGYFGEQKNLVQGNRYRPLSLMTFAAEIGFVGENTPSLSHWINILLYCLTVLLIIQLMNLLLLNKIKSSSDSKWLALAIGGLYLVHPLHVEAVANIKGRDEIMAMLFSLLTVYAAYRQSFNKKTSWLIAANVFYFLGLLSKENTITFLAIIPLTIYFFSSKSLMESIKQTWSFLLTTVLYLVLRFSVSGVPKLGQASNDLMNNPFVEMSSMEKLATIFYTLLMYIKLMFVPYPLTHDYYPYAIPIMNFGDWQTILSMVVYGLLILWAWKRFKLKSVDSYAILFYLITLTIVSNIVINLGTFMNDRFIYMPSLGFCILIGWGAYQLYSKFRKTGLYGSIALTAMVIGCFAFLSFQRVPVWESALTLNQAAIKVSSNSARANTFMSTALFQEGLAQNDSKQKLRLMQEALPYAKKSIEIYPTYYNGNLMISGIAAEIHKVDQKIDPLIETFEKVMKIRPDIGFLTDYLKYLYDRNMDLDKLNPMIMRSSQFLLDRNKGSDAKWALHYLNFVYQKNSNYPQINQLLARGYALLGDMQKSTQFSNMANGLSQ